MKSILVSARLASWSFVFFLCTVALGACVFMVAGDNERAWLVVALGFFVTFVVVSISAALKRLGV